MIMKYIYPIIVSLIVGSLFSWAYLSTYGFGITYLIFVSMMIGVVFIAFDAWKNRDKQIEMNKNIFQNMGPSDDENKNNSSETKNPNKARNWVLTWYSLVATVVIIYLLVR